MRKLFFVVVGFFVLSGCQTASNSSQETQTELEKYLGKKVEYKQTVITQDELNYQVIYFDSSINLYHDAPLGMSYVSMLKSYISEVSIHAATTEKFDGTLSLPYPGLIWEGSSNLFIRIIDKTGSETFTGETLDSFIKKYNGRIWGDQNGQSKLVLSSFPRNTEIEYTVSSRTTGTPSLISFKWHDDSKFRRFSIRTNLTPSIIQWRTDLPLIFAENRSGVASLFSENTDGVSNNLGKILTGKESADLVNSAYRTAGLTIFIADGYDFKSVTEQQIAGLDVYGYFGISSAMNKGNYESLLSDLFLQAGFNKEKRLELGTKPSKEIFSTLTMKLNAIGSWDFLSKYFSVNDLTYRLETIKKLSLFFMLGSYTLKDIEIGYEYNTAEHEISLKEILISGAEQSVKTVGTNFPDELPKKSLKTKK